MEFGQGIWPVTERRSDRGTERRRDGAMEGRTDTTSYRHAEAHLKSKFMQIFVTMPKKLSLHDKLLAFWSYTGWQALGRLALGRQSLGRQAC